MAIKKKPVTPEQACLKMATLCSHSEQCEFDIRKKLFNMGLSTKDQKEIIDYLKDEKFIDNQRYANSFVSDKARFANWGPYKIRASLMLKKISPAMISEAIGKIEPDVWKTGIMRLASAKAKNLSLVGPDNQENRAKLYRYLLGRGFSSADSVNAVKIQRKLQYDQGE